MRISILLRAVKHRLLLFKHRLIGKTGTLDLVAEAMIGVAARWHGEIDPIHSYTVMIDILKQNKISGRGLEIGGGYSTILLCELVHSCGITLESIDVNPDKYLRIIPSASARKFLFSSISRIDELSVSLKELEHAYKSILPDRISKLGKEQFRSALMGFCRDHDSYVDNLIDLESIDITVLGSKLLALPSFEDEKSFYVKNQLESGHGYCSQLLHQSHEYDFIFFDCGEYSSLAEWFLLEGKIKIGGFVMLHDIYYPKSIKNFIVAAFIASSENWEVLYVDEFSTQGAMVAKRVA